MLDFKKNFKLETLEIDVANKIFKLNGEDFGKDCSGFNLSYDCETYTITLDLDTEVHYFSGKPSRDEVEHFVEQKII